MISVTAKHARAHHASMVSPAGRRRERRRVAPTRVEAVVAARAPAPRDRRRRDHAIAGSRRGRCRPAGFGCRYCRRSCAGILSIAPKMWPGRHHASRFCQCSAARRAERGRARKRAAAGSASISDRHRRRHVGRAEPQSGRRPPTPPPNRVNACIFSASRLPLARAFIMRGHQQSSRISHSSPNQRRSILTAFTCIFASCAR